MIKKHALILVSGLIVFAIGISSCLKDESSNENLNEVQEIEIFEINIIEEEIIDDIFSEVMDDLDQFNLFKSTDSSSCPVKTIEFPTNSIFPKVVTRDYGEACLSAWGKLRSGKIIITYESKPSEVGSVRKVDFENYSVDSVLITGHKVIEYLGTSEDGYPKYKIIGNVKLIQPNGIETHRIIHKQRTKIAGFETKEKSDDEWLIEGTVKVKKSNGVHFTTTIIFPLHQLKSCKWIVSGTKEIEVYQNSGDMVNNLPLGTIVIDYGDGECDNIATKKINDQDPVEFELKKRNSKN